MNISDQYCSELTIEKKIDPSWISLNHNFDFYIVGEISKPWHKKIDKSKTFPQTLSDNFEILRNNGIRTKFLGLNRDEEYCQDGLLKVIIYIKRQEFFRNFEKLEYDIPTALFTNLIFDVCRGLTNKYESYKNKDITEDIFICTHNQRDLCCGKFGVELYERLKENVKSKKRIWKSSHIGGHRLAPTMISFPEGRLWGLLDIESAINIINRQGDHMDIISKYRGSMGLNRYAQILEKEIFNERGWNWLTVKKTSRIIHENSSYVDVEVRYVLNGKKGSYQAKINKTGLIFISKSVCSDEAQIPSYEIVDFNHNFIT